jgi:hypothetical protein
MPTAHLQTPQFQQRSEIFSFAALRLCDFALKPLPDV